MLPRIGLVLIIATVLATFSRRLRLPLILGYLLAGIVVSILGRSFLGYDLGGEIGSVIELLGSLGIAFLLFSVGVELNFKEVKEVGPVSLVVGVGQVIVTSVVGFILAHLVFGFSVLSSLYIAVALTFSSTIIVVKLLSEKGDINSLYGRIAVGMLLVQDLIAVFALILLSSFGSSGDLGALGSSGVLKLLVGVTLVKGVLLFLLALLLTQVVTPWVFHSLSDSSE